MQDIIEYRITEIIKSVIPVYTSEELLSSTSFEDSGIVFDSVEIILIVIELEREFDIRFSDEDIILGFNSIIEIKDIISRYIS